MTARSRQFGGDSASLDAQYRRCFRKEGDEALDDSIDFLRRLAAGPPWRPTWDEVKNKSDEPLPQESKEFASLYRHFLKIFSLVALKIPMRFRGFARVSPGGGRSGGERRQPITATMP